MSTEEIADMKTDWKAMDQMVNDGGKLVPLQEQDDQEEDEVRLLRYELRQHRAQMIRIEAYLWRLLDKLRA